VIQLLLIPVLALTVALLILAESRGARRTAYALKPAATVLVLVVAALSLGEATVDSRYTTWLLVGLGFSLAGDVALMFPSQRAFLLGLIAFLVAHIVYAGIFSLYNVLQAADLVTGSLLLVAAAAVYRYLLPGLGKLRLPVLLYISVICFMVNRAVSSLFGDAFTPTQAWLVGVGAVLFWVSDLMLGINRFRRPFRYHRISLAFYYAGQLLIALSASYSA